MGIRGWSGGGGAEERDARVLAFVTHAAFFLLLGSSLARFAQRHGGEPRAPWTVALAAVLALLYLVELATGAFTEARGAVSRPRWDRLLWLVAVVAVWAVLVALAPSFAWVAVPLFYTVLRMLPTRAAYVLVGLLTVLVVIAQLQLARRVDVDLVVGPPAVAALATAVFTRMERQAQRQRALIDDLSTMRRELAATERRAGTLAERQRLSMEIHDTLAQGLSSQQMLLQAAERTWESAPDKARGHVRSATAIAEHNLTEARRFVQDLAPADLVQAGGSLHQALGALAGRESGERLTVRLHLDGSDAELPETVRAALLRIAQGALANVREHSGAATAALTLTCLDDQVVLDVADDGRGFDPAAAPGRTADGRGHGVAAMRARVRQLGGTLTIESRPGSGTVVTAAVPLEPN
ncbi:sensor histidine kinase [Streptomyces sp. NPDC058045]|uniref:sensor histidine kinase n=1 Tax=Streptomyces sp. NPDC058045 TaxID=3346311 RepID=UPI0036E4B8C6